MARARSGKKVAIGKSVAVDKPVLRLSLSSGRMRWLTGTIALSFGALTAGAVYAHLGQPDKVRETGLLSTTKTISTKASRGKIFDRNGIVLASSLPVSRVAIDPVAFEQVYETRDDDNGTAKLDALAKLLGLPRAEVRKKVRNSSRRWVSLARDVDMDIVNQIEKLRVPGIDLESGFVRRYPEGPAAAQVVGVVDFKGMGQTGIEAKADESLTGSEGSRQVWRDRMGRRIGAISDVEAPRPGGDIRLSIDSRLQYQAYTALQEAVVEFKAKAASTVVLDVDTGEVLAMANWPSFDPNDRRKVNVRSMNNSVVANRFEPGSTIKPFPVALALELRKITPRTLIDTGNGKLTIGPDTIGDSHKVGVVTVEQAVEKSSNVATAKIALDMKAEQMWSFYSAIGVGQPPKIEFPGVTAGSLRPYRKWRPIEQATMAYGYGLSASLLQLARAYMIFARDGDLPDVTIYKHDAHMPGRQIISSRTAKQVRKMLEMAAGPNGTARKSHIVGYRVAGKTGTSRKIRDGQYVKEYASTFVGMVPASAPRIIIATFVDEPSGSKYYAGDVSAPVFARVASHALRYMRIAPDAPVAEIDVPEEAEKVSRR